MEIETNSLIQESESLPISDILPLVPHPDALPPRTTEQLPDITFTRSQLRILGDSDAIKQRPSNTRPARHHPYQRTASRRSALAVRGRGKDIGTKIGSLWAEAYENAARMTRDISPYYTEPPQPEPAPLSIETYTAQANMVSDMVIHEQFVNSGPALELPGVEPLVHSSASQLMPIDDIEFHMVAVAPTPQPLQPTPTLPALPAALPALPALPSSQLPLPTVGVADTSMEEVSHMQQEIQHQKPVQEGSESAAIQLQQPQLPQKSQTPQAPQPEVVQQASQLATTQLQPPQQSQPTQPPQIPQPQLVQKAPQPASYQVQQCQKQPQPAQTPALGLSLAFTPQPSTFASRRHQPSKGRRKAKTGRKPAAKPASKSTPAWWVLNEDDFEEEEEEEEMDEEEFLMHKELEESRAEEARAAAQADFAAAQAEVEEQEAAEAELEPLSEEE